MYFWKCWRESLGQFIAGVVVTAAVCGVFEIVAAKTGGPAVVRTGVHPTVAQAWAAVIGAGLGALGALQTLIWGMLLGPKGVGNEFERKTADFLFTRPRRRRYWVWVGWSAGAVDVAAIVLAATATTYSLLIYATGQFNAWRLLAAIPGLAIGGAITYGSTCFLTIVTRSGRQGLSYGAGLLSIALFLPYLARFYWKIDLPSLFGFMDATCDWAAGSAHSFPFGTAVLWAMVALAFPLASQLVVDRASI